MRTPVNYGPARRKTPERQVCGAHPGSVTLSAHAKVAELADAPDLGSGSRKAMGVRVPPFAPAFARVRRRRAPADHLKFLRSFRSFRLDPKLLRSSDPQILKFTELHEDRI